MPEDVMTTATAGSEITNEQQLSTEQVADTGDTGHVEQTTAQETAQEKQERMFRQSELDRIIKDRLAKERQRFESELRSHPVLSYLEQKAQRLGITVEQLIENDRKFEEQQALNELIQKNIPEEYARKLLEHDKIIKEYQTEKQAREQREAQQKMLAEFLDAYPDVKPEEIPVEVWKEFKQGRSLLDAYIRYENKKLKEEVAKIQQQQQTAQANEKNAASSTGSVKSGKAVQGYISKEMYEQNKHNQKWLDANYDLIVSSMKHWK